MTRLNIDEMLIRNVRVLSERTDQEASMIPRGDSAFPSIRGAKEIISLIRAIIFPDFFDCRRNDTRIRSCHIGVNLENLYNLLCTETRRALRFDNTLDESDVAAKASELARGFIDTLPELKRILLTDVMAMYNNDPAADNYAEVILSYPVVLAMVHYRAAHALLSLGVPVLPRVITELAHSMTGIDINPGAQIGEYFAIDHGTGVVIGETCVIGDHVTLYQGVTLGARNFSLDSNGHPVNIPRHPILEDHVTVYSNASILGRITVGRNSVIGGNIWLTHSVPPNSRILQRRAVESTFIDGLGI